MDKIAFVFLSCLTFFICCTDNSTSKNNIDTQHTASADSAFKKVDTTYIPTGFYFLTEDKTARINIRKEGSNDIYSLSNLPFASVNNINQAKLQTTKLENGDYTELCMTFDTKGTSDLEYGTGNSSQPKIAVVIAGKLLYVVDNSTKIRTGVMCVGLVGYSEQQMIEIKEAVDQKK